MKGEKMKFKIKMIPKILRKVPQWVGFKIVETQDDKKPTKVPFDPNKSSLSKAKVNNNSTWGSFF